MHSSVTRREFLAVAGMALSGKTQSPSAESPIPYRSLGSTGERVSIVGLGGFHVGTQSDERTSIAIIRTAIDNGVNFMDNCWDYNKGASEVRMGKALRDGYRRRVFLMTKIDGRNARAAERQLDESLRRLQTDMIDLLQFHEIIRMSDPDRIFAPGGAIELAVRARKAGKVRFIGFTGHKNPDIHLKMLATADRHGFAFDAVQLPLNVMDAHYESFEKKALPVLVKRKIGVLGMKPIGSGAILKSGAVKADECLRYAMSLPADVVITGCDSMPILQQALRAAGNFRPLSGSERSALLSRTAAPSRRGEYEGYKTGEEFDSTSRHPEWLG